MRTVATSGQFGTNRQGWNRIRAELETEPILQQIECRTWVPPRLEPREDRLEEAMAALGVPVEESFGALANSCWRSIPEASERTER